jgi:hypothetical protein
MRDGGTASSLTVFIMISYALSPSKGRRPVRSS